MGLLVSCNEYLRVNRGINRKRKRVVMKKITFFLILTLITGTVQALVTLDADHANIQYTGRIVFDDALAPEFGWAGCYLIANFEGTSIGIKYTDTGDNDMEIILDDSDYRELDCLSGTHTYTVSGLSDTVHKIQLFKKTEMVEGNFVFKGFELDDDKGLLPPPARPRRRIEFYGDSITSGFSVDCTCNIDAPEHKNNYLAYGAVTARNLNAEYHCISRSGIPLVRAWWSENDMPNTYYYRHDFNDGGSNWNFSRWVPHIVVVNLGQNDYWHTGVPEVTQAEAQQAYIDFGLALRGHYPDAHIIFALGSMDAVDTGSPWPGYQQNAVNQLNTVHGDAKVYHLVFPYSGGPHPIASKQAVMATQLTEFINTSIPDPWIQNGDINLDGDVNNADFSKLSQQWQQTGCGDCGGADLTGDGNVTIADFLVLAQNWLNFTIIPGLQTPYPEGLAHTIPGRLEFEDYDFGGQGISYFDTTDQNAYGNYRSDDVDILPSDDIDEGFAVYAVASEWLEYTCDILPGTYTVTVRSSSSQATQSLTLSLDDQTLATFTLPATGGFNNWQETTIAGITIPGGSDRTLGFNLDESTAMLNYVDFVLN
jgi:hypothetical protein